MVVSIKSVYCIKYNFEVVSEMFNYEDRTGVFAGLYKSLVGMQH